MRKQDVPNSLDYFQPIAGQAANPEIDPKRRYLCRHVFTDGHRCGSPSLRGRDLCYNHIRTRREAPCATIGGAFVMPRIEDRTAVQLALYDVLSRLAGGDIEYKRASILLYGLQIASSNLARQEKLLAQRPPQVEEVTSDYHLGDLAPIVEITDTNSDAEAAPAPTPAHPAPPPQPVILSEAPQRSEGAQPKSLPRARRGDPEADHIAKDRLPLPPQTPVAQAATPSEENAPDVSSAPINPPKPAATDLPIEHRPYPLPIRDATGRLYPPPHKLDPPNNGIIPRLRTWRTPPPSGPGLHQPAASN